MLGCETSISHCGNQPAPHSERSCSKKLQQLQEALLVSLVSSSQTFLENRKYSICQPPGRSVPSKPQWEGHQHQARLFHRLQISHSGDSPVWGGGTGGASLDSLFAGSLAVFSLPAFPPIQRNSPVSLRLLRPGSQMRPVRQPFGRKSLPTTGTAARTRRLDLCKKNPNPPEKVCCCTPIGGSLGFHVAI